jgi:periplasmic divalent cation tolerance protein
MTEILILYATAPDEGVAAALAEALVDARAAACVNIIPGMTSVYRWEGRIETAAEAVMIIKTTTALARRAREIVEHGHPYENPAILAVPVDEARSSIAFCDWIKNSGPLPL